MMVMIMHKNNCGSLSTSTVTNMKGIFFELNHHTAEETNKANTKSNITSPILFSNYI